MPRAVSSTTIPLLCPQSKGMFYVGAILAFDSTKAFWIVSQPLAMFGAMSPSFSRWPRCPFTESSFIGRAPRTDPPSQADRPDDPFRPQPLQHQRFAATSLTRYTPSIGAWRSLVARVLWEH